MDQPKENGNEECCDETSEEEWTHTKSDNVQWLVQNAEELVRDSPKRSTSIQPPLNKISRVKEWLNMKRPDDSCDASGEDDEQESQTSEEFNESIITYRQVQSCESQNTSIIDLLVEQTPKVIKRGKLNSETRPWSVSCISQLASTPNRFNNPPKIFSTSESALYSLSKDFNEFANGCGGLGNNSTSSTVEESSALVLEEKCSPTRRKRFKLKKKCDYNKINHGALYHSTTLVKSGSFSGHPCVTSNSERHSVSDPSALYLCHFVHDSTTSGTESDDERKMRRMPNLKSRTRSSYLLSEIRSGSPVKNSILAAEEQSSSMSEQAWDGFQEDKYLSEPYSEAHDSDAARKLLEFGEDYGNYLGNQSDWSNQSTTFGFSPSLPRKCIKSINAADSDSESQDIKYLLKEYSDQLVYTGRIYKSQLEIGLSDYLVTKDKDVLETCNQYINSLNKTSLLDNPSKRSEVTDLITNWRLLRDRAIKMQEYFDIQKDVLLLKDRLCDIKSKISSNTLIFNSVDDLSRDIDFYTSELTNLQEQKRKLLAFNVTVHRFITTNKEYNSSFLKLDVPDLYRLWYDVHCSANDKIDQLNNLKQAWQMLESRLKQLRTDLREDKLTLDVLEDALNNGTLTNHILSSLKDVEKLLSETQIQGYNIPELFLEGSCSDSGISDEGSEHEFGEREHRLTAIRRLVRQLETLMNPECAARIQMNEGINAAEEELRNLQRRCRSIMVRSGSPDAFVHNRHLLSSDHGDFGILSSKTSSWFNRVKRLSLPLQFALMTLLCVAYFLEPQCCNNMNTFSISLTPHLNYIRGPPPI